MKAAPHYVLTPVPAFAADYPDTAQTLEQARLPFYCCNCYRKRPTAYLTPNVGPFCAECLGDEKNPQSAPTAVQQKEELLDMLEEGLIGWSSQTYKRVINTLKQEGRNPIET